MKKLALALWAVLILSGCAKEASVIKEISSAREYITVSFSGKPEFQPHSANSSAVGFCLGFIYEPLWRIKEDGALVPVLAKKMVNRGTEVDIYLAECVKWHDGSYLTPEDVVYTISLVAEGKSVYSKGIIEGAKVSGKGCVTVYLSAPLWEPEKLFTFPVIKSGAPLTTKTPVGTGVYKYSEKIGFDTYIFKPFKNSNLPQLRVIHVRDEVRETELFKAGITDIQFVENESIAGYIPMENSKVVKYPTNHIIYIGFNQNTLSSHFRRAVFYALDTLQMSEEVYERTGKSTVVPYLSEDSFSYKHIQSIPLSRSELLAGGFTMKDGILFSGNNRINVRIGVMQGGGHFQVAEFLQKTLSSMGVENSAEEWNEEHFDAYDVVIGTGDFCGDLLAETFEKNPVLRNSAKSRQEFNNAFFTQIPFIPVAFRCNVVFISPVFESENGVELPLFFGKSGILN